MRALALIAVLFFASTSLHAAGPYQATGLKTGETTATSTIVWMRLTAKAARNPADGPMVGFSFRGNSKEQRKINGIIYPDGAAAADLRDAAPGAPGETRVLYRPIGADEWNRTSWAPVDPKRDFTRQLTLDALTPHTEYELQVESRSPDQTVGQTLSGGFKTAPAADDPARVLFTVSTGQMFRDQDSPDGFKIYPTMQKSKPDFFVHTGDIVYYDLLAKDISLARYHWQRMYGLPTNVGFHRTVTSYFIKDDHDTWRNDCWSSMNSKTMFQFTFEQGLGVFREQVPMGKRTYRTYRWGKHLQVWMVEGRDFRSPNPLPDGPGKTIWGEAQKKWFKETVAASDATFRVLISPTPIVGPDRSSKHDNHSNDNFQHEGNELRSFLATQKNMAVVCGDRHWQYMSIDPKTKVREYSCGPASNKHAGGWSQSDFREDYHRYLKVIGGYLAAEVKPTDTGASLTFRYYSPDGDLHFEDQLESNRNE